MLRKLTCLTLLLPPLAACGEDPPPPVAITEFAVYPTRVRAMETAVLYWQASNAGICRVQTEPLGEKMMSADTPCGGLRETETGPIKSAITSTGAAGVAFISTQCESRLTLQCANVDEADAIAKGELSWSETHIIRDDIVVKIDAPIDPISHASIHWPARDLVVSAGESVFFAGSCSDADGVARPRWEVSPSPGAMLSDERYQREDLGPQPFMEPGLYTVTLRCLNAEGDAEAEPPAVHVQVL